MLGEAFLHVLNCREDTKKNHDGHTRSSTLKSRADPCTANATARTPLTPRTAKRAGRPEALEKPGQCRASAPSNAVPIMSCSGDGHLGTGLSCTWCCPSFYKDYPDLRLAGDRLEYSPHNPELLNPAEDGPLLQSQDLSSLEPSLEPRPPPETASLQDEEYLVMERARSPDWERRLTNSMLNGYLEVQMLEVFCQHMQNMACCGSSLLGTDVMPALGPTSLTVSKEQTAGQEEERASSSNNVVRYLSTCSAPATSHFSSPVLRISEAE